MKVPAFPKIPSFRGDADLLSAARRVICLEKIDGTNTRLGLSLAAVRSGQQDPAVGSRVLMENDEGYKQTVLGQTIRRHEGITKGLPQLVIDVQQDIVLYGETCGGRIQKMGFIYGAQPHFLLFGARVGGAWCSWSRAYQGSEGNLPSILQIAGERPVYRRLSQLRWHDWQRLRSAFVRAPGSFGAAG